MIEKISLALFDESGAVVPISKISDAQLEIKLDIAIAEMFTKICFRNNKLDEQQIKTAEKFNFALNLKNYLQELKENEFTF